MPDDFQNYIKQLQQMEQDDNRSRLQNFCDLNKSTLSYFKNIWNTLQSVLVNKEISPSIVDMVDGNMQALVRIKTEFEKLKKSEIDSSCTSKVQHIDETIKSMSLADCKYVEKELQDLIAENKYKLEHRPKKDPSVSLDHCIKQLKEGHCDFSKDLDLLEQIYLMPEHEELFVPYIKDLAAVAKREATLMKILNKCKYGARVVVVGNPNITQKVREKLLSDKSVYILNGIVRYNGNGWTSSDKALASKRAESINKAREATNSSGGCFSIIAIIVSVSISLFFII